MTPGDTARAVVAGLLLAVAGATRVEAQAVRATILGTVKDATGAVLPGVTVDAKNLETGVAQSVVSNQQGRFTLPDLPIGAYDVQGSMSGFQTVVRTGLTLTVGSETVVDFTLPLGQVAQTVTIVGGSSMVNTTSAAVATTISQKQIVELPLNGRNYAQLITLSPGVTTMPGNGSFFGRQPVYSVAGGRPEGQVFLLDNTNVANFWNRAAGSGVIGTTLGVDAIAEFQTLTNTYSAQFGGGGGAINAITRSGANGVHGSAFEFARNSAFDARGFFDDPTLPKPPAYRNQYGGSVGGPIRKDRAFFFLNYEGITSTSRDTKVATVPDANARNGLIPVAGVLTNVGVADAIRPVLDLYPLPTTLLGGGVGVVSQVASSFAHEHDVLGRVDYTFSPKRSFFARYVSDKAEAFDPFSGSSIPLWPATDKTNNQILTAEERRLMSSSVINQVRVGIVRTRERSDTTGEVSVLAFFPGRMNGFVSPGSGISGVGASQLNPFNILQRKYSVADDVYVSRGAHAIKIGGSIERQETDINAPSAWGGLWMFTGLQAFLRNQPASFVAALPGQDNSYREFRENDFTAYVQDDWKAAPKLSLNLGLRYAPTTNATVTPGITLVDPPRSPAFTPVDTVFAKNVSLRNVEPRLGVVYDPFENHQTSIRAGFGVFHNIVAPRVYASAYYLNPPYTIGRQDLSVVPPTFPTPFTAAVATLPTQTNGIDYQTHNTPYQEQWNVNVQREFVDATTVTVGYVGSHSENLFKQRDVNPVMPRTLADGTVVYGVPRGASQGITPNARLNPAFNALNTGTSFATSTYHSLQASLNRRFSRNVQAQVAYTLARCRDLSSGNFGPEGGTAATNPYDPAYDDGPCLFNRTHTLRASGVWVLPFRGNRVVEGWQLTWILNASSGIPFSPVIGFDQSGLGTGGQRPNLAPGRDLDSVVTGNINQWFDPTAFTLPAPGTLGTVGRNSLTGPNFMTLDLGVIKNVALHGSSSIQLRAETFNLTNRPNFLLPNPSVFAQTANGGGAYSPAAGRITALASATRQIQLALKVLF